LNRKAAAPNERGSSLVEAAIVVPVFLLMVSAVIDFGRAYSDYIAIVNAAREGARAAAKLPCFASGGSNFASYWQAVQAATRQAVSIRPG
jgi:Flp pilus assembly protein TadG